MNMKAIRPGAPAGQPPGSPRAEYRPAPDPLTDPAGVVNELYRAQAVPMVRLATLLLGDQASAEDVV